MQSHSNLYFAINLTENQLEDKKLVPNGKADKNILARRVALDITGLPPNIVNG